jgi:tRNA(Ile)-lysidine synthase
VAQAATQREVNPIVAVAASGGRDSTALLHATARAAKGSGLCVVALHVHHGLNPAADGWLQHVRQQCRRWAAAGLPVAFASRRLSGGPAPGQSVEAWARRERYAALTEMATEAGASLVLLAHHRRDQAETLLLQALRGGGPAGLSAMPRVAEREGIVWARPWLDQPAAAIDAYIGRHRLSHIEDDSNLDPRFDRNRLRHEVWPALTAAFPNAEKALAQATRRLQQAAELIDEVARADLPQLQTGEGRLDVPAWIRLSPARRLAALRIWLQSHAEEAVRESLLTRLAEELPGASTGQWPLSATLELRLYRGRLGIEGLAPPATVRQALAPMRLDRPGWLDLPAWHGRLELAPVEEGGIALDTLARAVLRARAAGDDFQLAPRSMPRSLKKQYQARGVPAWQRQGPVVALGARPLFVPGLGVDARAWAPPGEPQLAIRWWPQG